MARELRETARELRETGKGYNKWWWRTLSAAEQERILLRETSEPFAVHCIKTIFKQNAEATRAELETAEALTEEIEL